jgi:hypothetical protein
MALSFLKLTSKPVINPIDPPVIAPIVPIMVGTAPVAPVAAAPPDAVDAFLTDLNGDDAYSSSAQSRGKLSTSEYLRLPNTYNVVPVNHSEIGTKAVRSRMSRMETAQIYALNKAIYGTDDRAIKMGWLRVQLVKAGWLKGTYEVVKVAEDPNADATMTTDLAKIKEYNEDATKLSFLLPLATEYVFRVSGHHYLTSLSADYIAKYTKFFNACVESDLISYLAPEDLFHAVGHWTPLLSALMIAQDESLNEIVPNAVLTRARATPAGTAIIGTTDAVFDALEGAGFLEAIEEASNMSSVGIVDVTELLKKDPAKYHLMPYAYGATGPNVKELAAVVDARDVAINLAPVTQGFIDSLPKTSSLAGSRCLSKHADVNPVLRKRAKIFFKEVGKAKAGSIAELFAVDKRSKAAKAEDEIDEDES